MREMIQRLKAKHNCMFMVDMVYNHCASNATWILKEPTCYFSPKNTPQLGVAYKLDRNLYDLSISFVDLKITRSGLIESEDDIERVLDYIKEDIIKPLDILGHYQMDVGAILDQLKAHANEIKGDTIRDFSGTLSFLEYSSFDSLRKIMKNLGKCVNGVTFNIPELFDSFEHAITQLSWLEIRKILEFLNTSLAKSVRGWEEDIVSSLRGEIRYRFLEKKQKFVNKDLKLVSRYFCELSNEDVAAHNGWISGYDDTEDFAESTSNPYLRRQVNTWEDVVKLRFVSPEQTPLLWEKMTAYSEQMASLFDGFRLDNFHNSRLVAVSEFISKALAVNKHLLIMSELFVPCEEKESLFATAGGVHWLVCEGKNYPNSRAITDLVAYHLSLSSIDHSDFEYPLFDNKHSSIGAMLPTNPKVIICEQTHDNEPLITRIGHCSFQFPLTALLAFSSGPVGTLRGYDEVWTRFIPVNMRGNYPSAALPFSIPHSDGAVMITVSDRSFPGYSGSIHSVELRGSFDNWSYGIHSVRDDQGRFHALVETKEEFQFKFLVNGCWTVSNDYPVIKDKNGQSNNIFGSKAEGREFENLADARKYFNDLHVELTRDFPRSELSRIDNEVVVVHRFKEDCTEGVVLIAGLCFDETRAESRRTFTARIKGFVTGVEKTFINSGKKEFVDEGQFQRVKSQIFSESGESRYFGLGPERGLPENKNHEYLFVQNIPANFVIVLRVSFREQVNETIKELEEIFSTPVDQLGEHLAPQLSLGDMNYYFSTVDAEEKEYYQSGVFDLPHYGQLPFAGFTGLLQLVWHQSLHPSDLDPILATIESGNYLIDYYYNRIKRYNKHPKLIQLFERFKKVSEALPRFLLRIEFVHFIQYIGKALQQKFFSETKVSKILLLSTFVRQLLLAVHQFMTPSILDSKEVQDIKSELVRLEREGKIESSRSFYLEHELFLMSAGLPHFTIGVWKNWGRDTFISFTGALLVPGFFESAKMILLHYARHLRHGLIPNMLSPARFNARDATWWFIKGVRDYLDFTGDFSLLREPVDLCFLSDNEEIHHKMKAEGKRKVLIFVDLLHSIFQTHTDGIRFREWGGRAIDSNISEQGFNISLYVDWRTGFVGGGSKFNCLTWMDKMGSSEKAGNKGIPSTSRHGSPIETTALQYIGVRMMANLFREKHSNHLGVRKTEYSDISYEDWQKLLEANFDNYFHIPKKLEESSFSSILNSRVEPEFVTYKGIYKDCYSESRNDYLLRPNALVALALVPELLNVEGMTSHLRASKILLKPNSIGIKTLDPYHERYRPNYDNFNDSEDFELAHGFNYHNGPEWVWLYGYYVMAKHQTKVKQGKTTNPAYTLSILSNHMQMIHNSRWRSLPELTNDNGSFCHGSCVSQAWSIATLLEAIHLVTKNQK